MNHRRTSRAAGHLRRSLTATLALAALLLTQASSTFAATDIYVNKDSPQAADNCSTHGSAPKPLASVAHAVDTCAWMKTDDVTILVLCDPAAANCNYDLPAGNRFRALPGGRHATIRGEPSQMVRFRQPFDGKTENAIHVESNWTLTGLVFDGLKGADPKVAPETGGGAFIRLAGDGIAFTNNDVHNTPYICIAPMSGGETLADQHSNIEISHNHIYDCHTAKGPTSVEASIDRHCIYNRISRAVVIKFNDIHDCGGDGYAIENYLVGNPNGLTPMLSEVALDNVVLGNRFFTSCQGSVSWGENAIDVKRAGSGLIIRDNAMWGFRQARDKSVVCHGTGTGDPG